MRISNLYCDKPALNQEQIDAALVFLHDGSITHVLLTHDRKPVDLWGISFRIQRKVAGPQQSVTAASAGPDRKFETKDDIAYTTTSQATR